jgi:predicted enzyme related to lactoylglutathione lyase
MGQAVVHFEVIGRDGRILHEFYSGLFGWKIDTDNPVGYGVVARDDNLNAEGIGIGGGVMGSSDIPGMEGYEGHVTFYVEVPDVEEALATAERLGGTRRMGPDQVPDGPIIGQFVDPEGHLIGVTQAGTM